MMVETFALLAHGFASCLAPAPLAMIVVGIVIGMLVAILPGLTLVMGVALALPFTYNLDVTSAIVLLTAMYVSGTYGGAFTAILFRIPGEPIDVPILWDGYVMGRKDAAKALGWTLLAAVGGGLLSGVVMVAMTQPLASVALRFTSAEYFSILLFGLASVVTLGTALCNGLISLSIGLLIGCIGVDPIHGAYRLTFDSKLFAHGVDYLIVMVGAYGVGEVFTRLAAGFDTVHTRKVEAHTRLPTLKEVNGLWSVFLRSTGLGHLVGLIPGAGATIASFLSYGVEAQIGRRKSQLGTGIPEGIIAPQAAATASVAGAIVPLLVLGIPGSGATAVILGAFTLHGVQPGPQIFVNSTGLVYTVFASYFLSLLIMAIVGFLAIRVLVRILEFPEVMVSTYVLIFCFVGALAIRGTITDLWMMMAFGLVGFAMERLSIPIVPMVLGVILGPLAEEAFMNAMISYQNDVSVFFTRPISGAVMLMTIAIVLLALVRSQRARPKPTGA